MAIADTAGCCPDSALVQRGFMISWLMLPASFHLVNTRTADMPRHRRVRRNRLAALGVLLVHALLLALFWNGQPSQTQAAAPRVIEVSTLAPSQALVAAQPPAHRADHPAPPIASRPQTAPAPARSAAPSPRPDAAPTATAAASQTAQQPPGGAATTPLAASGTQTGPAQASNPAPPRVELPASSADYLDNPRPAYPALSRRLGEQGQVVLRIWVEADGRPGRIELRRSSGFERLDRAAQQAVQRWRFVPGKRAGTPEAMWAEVPLQFVLE